MEMKCESCGDLFNGRPNKKYCSDICKRDAANAIRRQRTADAYQRFLETLTPKEKWFYNSIKCTVDDLFLDPHERALKRILDQIKGIGNE